MLYDSAPESQEPTQGWTGAAADGLFNLLIGLGLVRTVESEGSATLTNATTLTFANPAQGPIRVGDPVVIAAGTGIRQAAEVIGTPSSQTVTIARAGSFTPDANSVFQVLPGRTSGAVQAAGASTLTLAPTASGAMNAYVGDTILITDGTGQGQTRKITAYDGTSPGDGGPRLGRPAQHDQPLPGR